MATKRKRDLFEGTRFRLTILYSGLLMLFLVLFIAIVYAILYETIFKDQQRELESSVNQEARSIEEYLQNQNPNGGLTFPNQESLERDVDQFFYYVVDQSGQLVLGDEQIPDFRTEFLSEVSGWTPKENEVRQKTFHVDFMEKSMMGKGMHKEFRPTQRTDTVRLMIAGQPISYKGEVIGVLYIGKEISFAYQVFKWLPIILLGIAVLFVGVALAISQYMSKKAMIPITQAFSRQREFVADASHELRTPLSVMLSSINAMEMTLEGSQEDYSHKLLGNMKHEVKRMTGLVGDLLTLARSDSGQVELVNERFDLRPLAAEAVEAIRPLAESKQIELHLDAPETVMVKGDAQRLTQLLYILLDNAMKYTPDGGKAQLSLTVKEKEVQIMMQDTGIGIAATEYVRIFDRFYRADKARTRQASGHGLGLAIAKWIAESHKGTIQVTSEVGKGSTFVVRLPVKI